MRVYFAGMETCYTQGLRDFKKSDNFFCTYYYKQKTDKTLEELNISNHDGLITIDSGAHSFFGFAGISCTSDSDGGSRQGDMPDPYLYFENYVQWVKANYDKISYFVELDLQDLLGQEVINGWRQRWKDEGLYEKCITVHHSMNTMDEYEAMIADSQSHYIGLEGFREKKIRLPYTKLLKYAYENKCRVHGFAMTNQRVMQRFPFYSVDSSSWTAVNRYGVIYKFSKGHMNQLKTTEAHFLKHALNPELMSHKRDRATQMRKLALTAVEFRKLEAYTTKLWLSRGINWKKLMEEN